jgi:hypothetical protein
MSEGPFSFPYEFPYFDNIYHQIWITDNGLFSFLQPFYNVFFPQSFPLSNDSCLVAGFWYSNTGSRFNNTGNKIYYQIHNDTSSSNWTMKVLNKTNDYIGNFFPQERPFKAKMVITGTWYYISIGNNRTDELNNTFQII